MSSDYDNQLTALKVMYCVQKDEKGACSISALIMTRRGDHWLTWDHREHDMGSVDKLHSWLSSFLSGVRLANPDIKITEHVSFSL